MTKQVQQESVRKTGLPWRKIYKWIFDHSKRLKINLDFKRVRDQQGQLDFSRTEQIFVVEHTA